MLPSLFNPYRLGSVPIFPPFAALAVAAVVQARCFIAGIDEGRYEVLRVSRRSPSKHDRSRRHNDNAARRGAARVGRPSQRSERDLDWVNFFMADVQSALGAFVAFYLPDLHWSKAAVGIALTSGGISGVAAQMPAGAQTHRRS